MPVYAVQQIEQGQRLVPFIPNKIGEELDACPEIGGKERNKLKTFLQAQGIPSITEMDYSLREKFEQNLKDEQQLKQVSRYLLAYDRIKQYSIRQQMQTLSGRLQCRWKLENKVLFLPYHPNQEIAMEFDSVRHRPNMVWDFTKLCSESLKKQIFLTLDAIIEQIKDMRKRECRLTGLKYLYEFCAEHQIADIEKLELDQIKEFEYYLDEKTNNPRRKELLLPILNFCRQTVFLQNDKIHWDANVWYLERMNLPKNRVNESGSFRSVSFIEITMPENRRYAQEFMKYQIGITGQSISTIVIKYNGVKQFLIWLCKNGQTACECSEEQVKEYLQELQKRNIIAKTYNEYVSGISQFYRLMVVHGHMERMPFHPEYYLKKVIRIHHDRSVSTDICTELLGKIYMLPEHLRCMYLHLWCLGLRISEVCTLKGNAYYRKDNETWIKVYQIKMKTYKRIPIAEGLYKIMQVYIKRKHIGPDDYLFTNRNGGAYLTATFREQMKRFCEIQGVDGGEYLFQSHDYRHTVATFFYDNGASLQSVRDYLGHSYQEMTEQYIDYVPKKIAKANDEYFKQPGHSLAAGLRKGGKHGG